MGLKSLACEDAHWEKLFALDLTEDWCKHGVECVCEDV